jgi:hypothetical protein
MRTGWSLTTGGNPVRKRFRQLRCDPAGAPSAKNPGWDRRGDRRSQLMARGGRAMHGTMRPVVVGLVAVAIAMLVGTPPVAAKGEGRKLVKKPGPFKIEANRDRESAQGAQGARRRGTRGLALGSALAPPGNTASPAATTSCCTATPAPTRRSSRRSSSTTAPAARAGPPDFFKARLPLRIRAAEPRRQVVGADCVVPGQSSLK